MFIYTTFVIYVIVGAVGCREDTKEIDAFQTLFKEVAHGVSSPARCIPMSRGGPLKEKMKEKQLEKRWFKKDGEVASCHQSATQRNEEDARDHHFLFQISCTGTFFPGHKFHPVSASISSNHHVIIPNHAIIM